ncbi:ThiF family adenylyltransferase [Pseudoxanthomonas sp. z9]|uniref:ThiF family adenylyltransferase n=1 Tax=Pseudoxanthomonas sp. z9 TaxID=2584942 RepID=UPI0015E87E35|nr:ThiF family adenylyltransferase [Pseudoxanthomonas sp. z9]
MRVTLVLTETLAEQIAEAAAGAVESGGVLLARVMQIDQEVRLLARRYVPVPTEHYELQAVDALTVRADGFVPALAAAEQDQAVAIWFHTHPGLQSAPLPSLHDDQVDRELAETVRIRTNQPYYATLIASPSESGPFRFSGTLQTPTQVWTIDRIWIVGERWRLLPAVDSPQSAAPPRYDRNVRAFGSDIQAALGQLKIGVVGCGGTGSAVIEQLARLGVRDFVLIDPKALTESNVTRVYGSSLAQVGADKVEVAREHVAKIAPHAYVQAVVGSLTNADTTAALAGCDLVFGCTDDEAGRLVLSRFSTYLLCPVIDCGVLISSDATGVIIGIDGRVTILSPGGACLICRNRIDTALAAAQMLPAHEYRLRQAEGYAPALGNVEPAVVTFTTAVAAAAVNELLERMIGFGPDPRPSEVLLRFHEREISTNRRQPRPRHYCHPDAGKWGHGVVAPFLDLGWPS